MMFSYQVIDYREKGDSALSSRVLFTLFGKFGKENIQSNQAGSYWVVVTNYVGSVTSVAAMLTVTNPPPPSLGDAAMAGNGFTFQLSVPAGRHLRHPDDDQPPGLDSHFHQCRPDRQRCFYRYLSHQQQDAVLPGDGPVNSFRLGEAAQ
jgi:hypothetical protein